MSSPNTTLYPIYSRKLKRIPIQKSGEHNCVGVLTPAGASALCPALGAVVKTSLSTPP